VNRFPFWQQWLFVVCLAIVIFGLVLAVFNQTPIFDFLFNNQVNLAFWGTQEGPEIAVGFQRWIYGVLGATMAGWGVCLAFLARYPFQRRERWAWTCMVTGLLLWYVVDTAISLAYVPFNVAFNTLLLAAIGLPLLATRKAFRHE
jgi:hypothetical protein